MNYQINHGAYPDRCRIYRRRNVSNLSEGDIEIIYQGECHLYGSGQMRKFTNGNVVKADYCVDFPYVLKRNRILAGDLIDVEGNEGFFEQQEIVVPAGDNIVNLGTTVFFNITLN